MVSRYGNTEYHDLINRDKLRGKMAEVKMSQTCLASNLNITPSALTRKMKSSTDFNENEIYIMYKLFGSNIFFD